MGLTFFCSEKQQQDGGEEEDDEEALGQGNTSANIERNTEREISAGPELTATASLHLIYYVRHIIIG